MNTKHVTITIIVLLTIAALTCTGSAELQADTPDAALHTTALVIPEAVQVEHAAIHATLVEATQAPGDVGIAAKELAHILHPHFVREEQIALPPLGLLAALAANTPLSDSVLSDALAMSDALRAELPHMLEEHKQIRAAVENLLVVARAEKATKVVRLAEELALHAQTEEELFYPMTLLVGDVIRARAQSK